MAEEKNYENKVRRWLQKRGAWEVKFFGCRYTRKGVPDLLVCYRGRFLGIEMKATKGKVSQYQTRELDRIRQAGGVALVLFPDSFHLLEEACDKIDREVDGANVTDSQKVSE